MVGGRPRRCFIATDEAGGMFGFLRPIESTFENRISSEAGGSVGVSCGVLRAWYGDYIREKQESRY